jgi:cytochrome P450
VSETTSVHRLTGLSALTTLVDLAGASVAAGAIARRRIVVGLLEHRQADRRSIDRLHALRRKHGDGPVELVLPGRRFLVPLQPRDVGRILDGAPSPFDPASWEKRRALDKFQPHAVLITRGPLRAPRRALNEAALDTHAELHHLAGPFSAIIAEETAAFCAETLRRGSLTSAQFTVAWWKLVRRLVLGRSARDDDAITDDLWRLRRAGNWSFAAPTHARRRARFAERIYRYAENADPNSLLGALAKIPAGGELDPMGQLPHWLFAFDAAGMATIRAMALLATHPDAQQRCETAEPDVPQLRPYLRACVQESIRLWPTTPALLRETTEQTSWGDGAQRFTIDAGASVLICVPAFHRDAETLPFADVFTPDIWLDGRAGAYPQLVPFSAGPAQCPGQNVVLFAASTFLAQVLSRLELDLRSTPKLSPSNPLPVTLNQFGLRFGARPMSARTRAD